MAFVPWKKNKQIMINNIQEEDPAKSQNKSESRMTRSNIVEQSNIINMNGFKSHSDHQENYGSVGSGSVNSERTSFININRLKLFGRRGSSSTSTTTTHENEDKPIDSEVDCTLRLGTPTEPPSKPQQQVPLNPLEGDHHLSAIINNYFAPNNVVPQELMQNYEVMNGTPPYHQPQPQPHPQHINNRFGMNNYQLQQLIMNNNNNNNMIVGNHGMFHGEGSPSTMNVGGNSNTTTNMIINNHGMLHGGGNPSPMNVGGNSSNNKMILNNHGMFLGSPSIMNVGGNSSGSTNMIVGSHGMFHGGGSPNNLIVNNHGMFNGGGIPSNMNVGGNGSIGNNFGMFHGGRGGGDPSSVVVALPSPGGGTVRDGFNTYNIPHPPPPPNNFHVPFPNNNIPPPFPQLLPAPPVFLAAPRGNGPYYQNYAPQREPEKRCFACDTTRTPLWRNGPKGPKSLCNACGIRYKKEVRRIMGVVAADGGQQGEAAYRRNRF